MKTILLTCCGGSPVPYLAKTMRKKFRIVLANADDQRILAASLNLPFELLPFGNAPNYVAAITRVVKKWGVDYIVPGADEELVPLATAHQNGKLPTIIAPTLEFITATLHKKNIVDLLVREHIASLKTFDAISDVRYPAIVKPIYGRGSRAMHAVQNASELEGYFKLYDKAWKDVVVEPEIGGEEYTVSVIVNDQNALIGIVPKRIITKYGITRSAVTERNAAIERACKKIVELIRPCGPFNVQLKLYEGKIYIFEINPRLSTTAVLTDQSFGNEIELYLTYVGQTRIMNPPRLKTGIVFTRHDAECFKKKGRILCI
jgi:carbamoyl-phosphate synthase large subunit